MLANKKAIFQVRWNLRSYIPKGESVSRSLSESDKQRVVSFCDVDVKKIKRAWLEDYDEKARVVRWKLPIVHVKLRISIERMWQDARDIFAQSNGSSVDNWSRHSITFTFTMIFLILLITLQAVFAQESNDTMKLLLVQAMWRHGDRTPTKTFTSDPFREANWTKGGGGFEQLTPEGMYQQMELGKLIRGRYVDLLKFLPPQYSSSKIYVRATDTNRTIVSAMSNMIGMYGQESNKHEAGKDFPKNLTGWPAFYVPIAIHTLHKPTDYVGHPDADCNRRNKLWKMVMESEEVQEYKNNVSKLLEDLEKKCGQPIPLDDISVVRDPLYIEQIHFPKELKERTPWFNEELYKKIDAMYSRTEGFKYSLFEKPLIVNGLDVGHELMKVRGGPFFNEIADHMDLKLDCWDSKDKKCAWMKELQYYAYSVHDSTVYQFLTLLGIGRKVVVPGLLPEYAAATFVELWLDKSNKPFFNVLYHPHEKSLDIYSVTKEIEGCNGKEYCDLDVFRKIASKYKPEVPMAEYCETDPNDPNNGSAPKAALWAIFVLVFYTTL
ncbi:unnamed protein product [Cylicocyclus nassatus]|uniref:acid phosphatase n=1 Tax=Cylicocyclus nassatus TaxID=53992 RepID=A0AA36H968_CYLNA|nr:unnamed protein product [Cylicocyclus nassatus]